MRERELQQLSLAFCSSNGQTLSLGQNNEQFNTYQEDSRSQQQQNQDNSIRKRAKIFEPRPSSQAELLQHRESSKIMQENSTNDYTKQKSSKASEEPHHNIHSHSQVPSHPTSHAQSLPQSPLVSSAVQTASEYPLA